MRKMADFIIAEYHDRHETAGDPVSEVTESVPAP
jgi:hypothetical protein